jgi:hypothetical protein
LEEEFNVVPGSRAPEVSYLNLPFWIFPESTQLTSNINILGLFHLGMQWPPVGQAAFWLGCNLLFHQVLFQSVTGFPPPFDSRL